MHVAGKDTAGQPFDRNECGLTVRVVEFMPFAVILITDKTAHGKIDIIRDPGRICKQQSTATGFHCTIGEIRFVTGNIDIVCSTAGGENQ